MQQMMQLPKHVILLTSMHNMHLKIGIPHEAEW